MELLLKRKWKRDNYTIGKLNVNGEYFCNSLEDKDRGLKDTMSVDYIKKVKVYGETAIPTGTYKVTYTYSPKFKRFLPLINGVKGFEGIRIHSGNTNRDTLGCILLGLNTEVGKVTSSRVYCDRLNKLIEDAVKNKEGIILKIE